MIIDAHVHILSERMRAQRDRIAAADAWFATCHRDERPMATAEELIAAMDAGGINRSVCFAWPFADPALCAEANDHLAGVQKRHPDRVIACATINPGDPEASHELARCARMGLRGVGELNCDAQGFRLDDPLVDAAARTSIELGLPWNLHCSEPVGHRYPGKGSTTPDQVAAFATRHPDLQLICAHLGGGLPFYAHMPEVRELCRRLWFDTAAVPFLYQPSAYRVLVDLIGADRLLFGSDYPLLGVDRYVKEFGAAGLTDEEQRAVLGSNAAAAFHIV